MTQMMTSSISNALASQSSRSSVGDFRSQSDDVDQVGRFSNMLDQTAASRTQSQDEIEKKAQKTDKKVDQSTDKSAADSGDELADEAVVDEQPQDDQQTPDQIDVGMTAAGQQHKDAGKDQQHASEPTTFASQQALSGNLDEAQTRLNVTASQKTVAQVQDDSTTPKPAKDIADAMLRMLGVTNGQTSGSQQATFTLTDVVAPAMAFNTSTDQSATQQQLQLPDTHTSDTSDSANVGRVSRALANAVNQKGGTITIRMMPPELGQVRVDIQMHGGKVSASFQTEQSSVQSLMTRELAQLRQALERQGLTVEKLEVTQRPANSSNANASNQDSQQQSPSDGRSRGQYARQNQQQPNETDQQSSVNDPQNFASQLDSQL